MEATPLAGATSNLQNSIATKWNMRPRLWTLRTISTSWGTIQGLSLSYTTWIRDDWQLPLCNMSDKRND